MIGESLSMNDPIGIARFADLWAEAKSLAGDNEEGAPEIAKNIERMSVEKVLCNTRANDPKFNGPTGHIIMA